MAATSNKDVAYATLKDSGNRSTIDLVRDLLIAFREDARTASDTGRTWEEVLRNQGSIRICNELLETWLKFGDVK